MSLVPTAHPPPVFLSPSPATPSDTSPTEMMAGVEPDIGNIILIGEPNSGYREVFKFVPNTTITIGRPSHSHRHVGNVAYFPSRAVSRTHAIITMEADGVYITHLRTTNATWRSVDQTWTSIKAGDKIRILDKDVLCFGSNNAKSKALQGRVDAPMKIYVVLAPRGEGAMAMNRYRFIKRPIHRPVRTGRKAKFDPGVDMLLGTMQNLNVTLDSTSSDSYQVTNSSEPPAAVKRKRSEAPSDASAFFSGSQRSIASLPSESAKKRRLPGDSARAYCQDVDSLPNTLNEMTLA